MIHILNYLLCHVIDIVLTVCMMHEQFEDTNGVIKRRKSKKGRQYNCQMQKDKGPSNDLQSIAQVAKDRATQTPLKTGDELM